MRENLGCLSGRGLSTSQRRDGSVRDLGAEPCRTTTRRVTAWCRREAQPLLVAANTMRRTWLCSLLLLSATAACLDEGKGDEEELEVLDDSKADSHLKPTNHGVIIFGIPENAIIADGARFHAWTFELTGDAKVDMTTSYSLLGQRRTDTVLYLYKQKPDGTWGSYIARNDDYGSTTYSQLKKNLGAGDYRVLVKGHSATTTGKFKITVNCDGDGCAQPEPAPDTSTCVFGTTYHDIFENNPHITVLQKTKIYPNTLATLSFADRQRLLVAVQQSAHDDVTTPEEAILRVDQDEVNVTFLDDESGARQFVAFEYGAGDNSYGAVFDRWGAGPTYGMVTNIHDGDLENCSTAPGVCVFDQDWTSVRTNTTEFTITNTRTISSANVPSGVVAQQALITLEQSYDDLTSLADGLDRTDDHLITIYTLTHDPSGTQLESFVYHAGDTAVGRIFKKGTTTRAAVINDLFIEGCALFE